MPFCILPSKMHGDAYLRGLMWEEIIGRSVWPKDLPTGVVLISTLSKEPPLTSPEGSLKVAS